MPDELPGRHGHSAPLQPPERPLGLPVVYLVDDEAVVRKALAWLLRSCRLLSEEFGSAEAFEAMLDQDLERLLDGPRCVLLDIRMSGRTGLELFETLHQRDLLARMPVIFLTGQGDVPTAVQTVKRGAFDFVEKPFSNNALIGRIEQALAQSATALRAWQAERSVQVRLATLSPREHEILQRVLRGEPNKVIADDLSISVRTVEVHRGRLFEKMKVASALELMNLMYRPPSDRTA